MNKSTVMGLVGGLVVGLLIGSLALRWASPYLMESSIAHAVAQPSSSNFKISK